jgi:hypothetical protein
MTGPMLPAGVESKVEQYLKKMLPTPASAVSQLRAASDIFTAEPASNARALSATTTASHTSSGVASSGGPNSRMVRSPCRRNAAATSVPPV